MTLSKLPSRPAYTLIELMVVVGLIVLLATLTVAVANSSLVDSYKIVGSADRLSGWLLTAKQRALRDKTPVGVRFIRGSTNPADAEFYFIRQAQLVEMPTLYAPNQESNANNLPGYAPFVAIRYTNTPPTSPTNPNDLIQESVPNEAGVYLYWPPNGPPNMVYPSLMPGVDLQIGDVLRIGELNTTHRISNITSVAAPTWFQFAVPPPDPNSATAAKLYKLTLTISTLNVTGTPTQPFYPPSPPYPTNLLPVNATVPPVVGTAPNATYPTGYPPIGGANFFKSTYFGLFRGSRPILGEPLLQLPANMAVDVTPLQDVAPLNTLSAGDLLPLSQNIPSNQVGDLEIIFNPNGTVLFSTSGGTGNIIFWLRDTRNSPVPPLMVTGYNPTTGDVQVDRKRLMDAGEHVLVSVGTKTGAIATYPIFPPDQNQTYYGASDGGTAGPYKYARQATNTGL
jgi:hypothetical protein